MNGSQIIIGPVHGPRPIYYYYYYCRLLIQLFPSSSVSFFASSLLRFFASSLRRPPLPSIRRRRRPRRPPPLCNTGNHPLNRIWFGKLQSSVSILPNSLSIGFLGFDLDGFGYRGFLFLNLQEGVRIRRWVVRAEGFGGWSWAVRSSIGGGGEVDSEIATTW